ncbi:uncharacterized protein LOC129727094 isoform X4 [Wyeomyia smithii]|uniref:uncharacterized protein LOC129727094 isoform X4 n=1 Tax=Wyeomyia smithii TaxID=174621 RepID=UPI00246816AF|nr:uncharacterized protein LOC129727094 isoform X4 [Wyeomyia smithii]
MDNENCKNMVSNLPLLFAGGYPTSLEKINETQLEKFIPFMVQCSLGYIQIPTLEEYSEPEWWPGDLEFLVPFNRPKSFDGNWLEKMRELVVICYSFHKCVFLLRFCTDLASYEPATLRFINNYNSTTSLYQRRTNKLLVTFRNENMLYDQPPQSSYRKCLLPKQSNSQHCDLQAEQMVEPAFFDIYLCDDCDAELYSYDAYVTIRSILANEPKFHKTLTRQLDYKIVPNTKDLLHMNRILTKYFVEKQILQEKRYPSVQQKQKLSEQIIEAFPHLDQTRVCTQAPREVSTSSGGENAFYTRNFITLIFHSFNKRTV